MTVKLGTSNASLKIGSSNVIKIYKGSDVVYATATTILLLNFNGENGDTNTADASPENHTITFNGDVEISTVTSKFGGASAYFGQHNWLSIDNDDSLNFGTDQFTIEMWVYPMSFVTADPEGTCSCYAGSSGDDLNISGWFFESCGGNLNFGIRSGSTVSYFGDSNQAMTLNQWQHVAATRDSTGVVRLFLNGIEIGTSTEPGNISNNSEITIGGRLLTSRGGDGRFRSFDGYIDDLRIVKGAAIYTSNFTPPASQLTTYP